MSNDYDTPEDRRDGHLCVRPGGAVYCTEVHERTWAA